MTARPSKRHTLAAVFVVSAVALSTTVAATTASAGPTDDADQTSAILVQPIQDALVVPGDDGKDHVEYELLVVSAFGAPVTLSSVTVLTPAGKELGVIDGAVLAAATQTLYDHTQSPVVPASGAVAVEVDLILPPGTAPKRVTHEIAYTIAPDAPGAVIIDDSVVHGPEVTIDRTAARVIQSPVEGAGWLASTACCTPNVHRDLRLAIDGNRIATAETFAVDYARVKNNRLYDGDGTQNEQFYGFGADVVAVADGTVVAVQDGKPETTPFVPMTPKSKADFGGNQVILQLAPNVYAAYLHLQPGTLTVKVGDTVKTGAPLAKLGNTGPSQGPHLHFSLLSKPDPFAGRSLPYVHDRFTLVGNVDFDTSSADHLVITPDSREVRKVYPLYGSVMDFAEAAS